MSLAINTNATHSAGKPTAYIVVGLPYSGKTDVAHQLKSRHGRHTVIVSSDVIRKKLREAPSGKSIFCEARKQMIGVLGYGHDVILDATNITHGQRQVTLRSIESHAGKIICIFVDVPLNTCLARYKRCNRHSYAKSHTERIKQMWKQLQTNCNNPIKANALGGFDEIHHYTGNGDGKFTIRIFHRPLCIHPPHKKGKRGRKEMFSKYSSQ